MPGKQLLCLEQYILEPELRPEYIEKAGKIMKQKKIHVGSVGDLRKKLQHFR